MPKLPLNDLPRQKLIEIIATYGRYIYDDPLRCKGLLLDYCAEYRREINILMNALEEQVVAELLISSTRESYEGLLSRLTWRLCENYGLAEDFARWGVESWALALGVLSEETLKTLNTAEEEPEEDKKFTPEWRAIGTSVRGDAHVRENLPNQDHISWKQNSDTGLPLVLAVADGHGDAQYFRSNEGAKLAVKVALQEMEDFFSEKNTTTIEHMVKDLLRTIVSKWKEDVEAHWLQNRLTEKEMKWLTDKENTALQQAVDANHTLPYGTTLLAALVTETFILYLQLGDGDILTVSETGRVTRLIARDQRLIANRTTSLCSATAIDDFRSHFQMHSDEQPALILLSTDGYANSFRNEEGFLKVGSDILIMMRADSVDAVAARMKGWLTTATKSGSGDDISLGILCRMSALEKKVDIVSPGSSQSVSMVDKPSTRSTGIVEEKAKDHVPGEVKDANEIERSQSAELPKKVAKVTSKAVSIVSKNGDGDYTTIGEAIRKAEPNTRIEVKPGVYNEGLIINKDLEIIGNGSREKIIIVSNTSACIQVKAQGPEIKRAKVGGLTLRGPSKKETAAVRLYNGQLLIDSCDISSSSFACVHISGLRANPTLRNCTIHDGAGFGISISKYAKGTIEDCDIYGNTSAGVIISNYATPIIRRCKIHNGKGSGIVVSETDEGSDIDVVSLNDKDRVQILDCDIFENALAGVEIQQIEVPPKSEPLIQKCRIYDNKGSGIFVDNNGRGTVEKCKVFHNASNAFAEVEITKGSKLTLGIGCKIYDGQKCGVLIHDKGQGEIEECEIYCNKLAGVEVKQEGKISLKKSYIKYGQKNGVWLHENGQGILEGCSVYGNEAAGIKIHQGDLPIDVHACKIYDSKGSGILIWGTGAEKVKVGDCDIFENENSGIEIRQEADPVIHDCRIYGGKGSGILARENGKGHILNSNIYDNAYAGIVIRQSDLRIEECRISVNAYQGIVASEQGKIDIKNCDVVGNKRGMLEMQAKCQATLNGKKLILTDHIVLFLRSLGLIKVR